MLFPLPGGEGVPQVQVRKFSITNDIGTLTSKQRYLPFGAERTDVGIISQTNYGYTGQRDMGMGLMDFKARFYSPVLGRFLQPDNIIPGMVNTQSWNRFSYVWNNPINFNDPTGYMGDGNNPCGVLGDQCSDTRPSPISFPTFPGTGNDNDVVHGHGGRGREKSNDGGKLIDILGLNNNSGLACTVGPSCNPDNLKCFQYMQHPRNGPGSWSWNEVSCSGPRMGPPTYYTYEGSIVPIIGLGVDTAGMIIDGASVLVSLGFGVPGFLVSTETEFFMSSIEFTWSGLLSVNGDYEAIYKDSTAKILDSTATRYTDSQKPVPIVGFTSSVVSAYNNILIISSSFVAHPAFLYSWDGSPPGTP